MIHVLIPVFNRIELTRRCIETLMLQTIYEEISVTIVDDNSSDGTAEWLKTEYPDITVLGGTGRLFWGGAIHFGIEYLLTKCNRGDFILLVNNDVELDLNVVKLLRDHIVSKDRRVIAGALAVDQSDRSSIVKSGTVVKNWFLNITEHLFLGQNFKSLKSDEAMKVDFITARCLLHPVEVFWQAGNYDANSFIHYGGDDEFSMRVKKFGIEAHLLPSAVVFLANSPGLKSGPFETLFGIRSSSNIINKMRLSYRVAPLGAKSCFFLVGIIKSIVVAIRNSF